MQYSCPHCSQGYTIGETYYRGGDIFSCSMTGCKKQSIIPLYCPVCQPQTVEQKAWLETPQGDLAGESFLCPSSHTFSVPATAASTHARLRNLGTELGQYHQGKRINTLRDNQTKNAVSGGYCAGICYDWIRRVLVSATPKLTYRNLEDTMPQTGTLTGEMSKQHRQDERGALMQRQNINPILTQKNNQLYAQYSSSHDSAQQTYLIEHQRINALPGTFAQKQPLWDGNTQTRNQAQALALQTYNTKVARPNMEKAWTDYRNLLDNAIGQQRGLLGKTTLRSARPFANLDLVAAQDSKEYTGTGLKNLINEVLNNSEFLPDRCAHVGVYPPNGGTGHAVAVHRQNTSGKYHFFDPNFGVYEMTRSNLVEAFEYIFGRAYPNWAGGGTSDDHPYEVNGRTKGDWSIFKSNRVAPPLIIQTPPVIVNQQPVKVKKLTVSTTVQIIPVTTQSGPVVTGTPTLVPSTNNSSGSGLQAPTTGATVFKQNLWKVLNDPTRKDGENVKVAYMLKAEIEKNGVSVMPSSGGFKVSRQSLTALYNRIN